MRAQAFAFGIRAHDLGRMRAPALAEAVLAAGFDRVQLAPRKALAEFEGAEGLDLATVRHVAREFASRGVSIDVLGSYIEPLHPDPPTRERELARLRESIEVCSAFGCPLVATETGWPAKQAGGGRGDVMEELAEALGGLCELASREGLSLALEPVWCHNLAGLAEAVRLVEAIASPGLGFLLDPVNLVPDAGLDEPAAPALAFIEGLGERIVAVHAKDFAISGGSKRILPCGRGDMGWAPLLDRLGALNPKLSIIFEELRPGEHGASRNALSSLLAGAHP